MTVAQKIAGGVAVAMVLTAVFLPGRSPQESAVFNGLTNLSKGSIQAAEGR
jgi:hypothetical protein